MLNIKRYAKISLLVMSVYISVSTSLHSETITFFDTYTNDIAAAGSINVNTGDVAIETSTPFDPTLGTLTGIDITFSGSASYSITTGTNFVGVPVPVPLPYVIISTFMLDITGVNGFYDFTSPVTQIVNRVASGAGSYTAFDINYSFGFSYDEMLDQFTGPVDISPGSETTPPAGISGGLSDFIDSPILPGDLIVTYILGFTEPGKLTALPTYIDVSNVLQVETKYTYTPVTEPVVPLPGAFWLFVSGALFLAGSLRARTGH